MNHLSIPPLEKVDEIRSKLAFLETRDNMTQIRNTCYQILLSQLLLQINNNYHIYKGGWHIFLYNYLRVVADCCEGILYCFKVKHLGKKPPGENNLVGLINYAKSVQSPGPAFDRRCRKSLEIIVDFRNNLHPDKQKELHIKKVDAITNEQRKVLVNLPTILIKELKNFYN